MNLYQGNVRDGGEGRVDSVGAVYEWPRPRDKVAHKVYKVYKVAS